MKTVFEVTTREGRSYPVLCGEDAALALPSIWREPWHQAVVIGDANTADLFAAPLVESLRGVARSVIRLRFPAGEAHKNRTTKADLEDAMLAAGVERGCCIVAVGGGVTLDLAGFVAATYMRGVPHINIATTLLAQIDAAVGGKTGINTVHGKNLVGAFHQPWAVLLDTTALRSLPADEMHNGLAEAVKHAVLSGGELFARFERFAAGAERILPEPLLVRCARIKAEVVQQDEREDGYRQVLNFGHTAGHAMEIATGHRISHGAAVSAGMVVEAHLACNLVGFPDADRARLERLLSALDLPTRPACSFSAAREYLKRDKKARDGNVHCALPIRLGDMDRGAGSWSRPVPLSLFAAVWEQLDGSSRS